MDWTETDRLTLPAGALAPMQQQPLYGAACATLGTRLLCLKLRRGGEITATALVLVRRLPVVGNLALLSRGPVWAEDIPPDARVAAIRALIGQLRRNLRGVLYTPELSGGPDPLEETGLLPMMTPGHVAQLELRRPRAAQRAQLHGKWRNRLVRAEAAGLRIRHAPLPADADHWVLRQETAQARIRGYRSLPRAFTRAWAADGGRAATRLFTANAGGTPVAAMLFLRHGDSCSYHIGWCGPEGRRLNAHNLLLWEAAGWLAREGHRRLDLGGIDTQNAPGLARFKLGTGAMAVRLGATWLDAPGTRIVTRLLGPTAPRYASSSASQ